MQKQNTKQSMKQKQQSQQHLKKLQYKLIGGFECPFSANKANAV